MKFYRYPSVATLVGVGLALLVGGAGLWVASSVAGPALRQAADQTVTTNPASDVWALLGVAFVVVILTTILLFSPFAGVLNIVAIPLGYFVNSCPYCTDVSIERLRTTECAVCETEIREQLSMGRSPAGDDEMYHFCSNDCYTGWREGT